MYIRGFAGYGGSPAGWRSIDGRFVFNIKNGELSPRLDADLVYHVPGHGFVKHLPHSDHGGLRWSVKLPDHGEASGSAGSPSATGEDFCDIPTEVSGALWDRTIEFAGKQSLANVAITRLEKYKLLLGVSGSRWLQFQLREKVDFLGSDASGLPWVQWEKTLHDWYEAAKEKLLVTNTTIEEPTDIRSLSRPRRGEATDTRQVGDEEDAEVAPRVDDRLDAEGDYEGPVEDEALGEEDSPDEGGTMPRSGWHEFDEKEVV